MKPAESHEVVITGVGPVTAAGVGPEAFWSALAKGHANVRTRTLAVDIGRTVEIPLAAMPGDEHIPGLDRHVQFLTDQEVPGYRDLGYTLLAIELALTDARLSYDRERNRIGVIQAFEAPGVERTVAQLFGQFSGPPATDGPPAVYDLLAPFFYHMQPFLYVHLVGKAFGLHGLSTSVHNACASGAFAMEIAADQIRSGLADVMIVAGGEAFDTGVRLEWFRRLDLYAASPEMRPFDAETTGFFAGEGAGAIVLESQAHAAARGATAYGRYVGGAFAHQGWKQVIPDVRSARLTELITRTLVDAGVSAGQLDLIVPHGAATELSDGYEAACLSQALEGAHEHAMAAAFKPYVGHMLAASGIIELIAALLAMRHQTVPATLHTRPDRLRLPIPIAASATPRPINTMLKLSTGFTGHDAATVFKRG